MNKKFNKLVLLCISLLILSYNINIYGFECDYSTIIENVYNKDMYQYSIMTYNDI